VSILHRRAAVKDRVREKFETNSDRKPDFVPGEAFGLPHERRRKAKASEPTTVPPGYFESRRDNVFTVGPSTRKPRRAPARKK
jgi:hypothetical protein